MFRKGLCVEYQSEWMDGDGSQKGGLLSTPSPTENFPTLLNFKV